MSEKVGRRKFVKVAAGAIIAAAAIGGGAYYLSKTGEEKVIKVGLLNGVTGPNADIGFQCRSGATLAIKQTNDAGGLQVGGTKYKIEAVEADHEAKVELGMSVAEKLITVDKIDVAIWGAFSTAFFFF